MQALPPITFWLKVIRSNSIIEPPRHSSTIQLNIVTPFRMPGWYCDDCEEGIHTGKDMKISDRMLNLLKARIEGLLEAKEIQRIRKKLGLSQEVAGKLIGGGPRAFQKYESGDLLPSRAVISALVLLDRYPAGLGELRKRQHLKTDEAA